MTPKHWLALIGLTLTAFIFNTSEFIPIGLLTDIASEFGMTEARAGMLISVYAWMVMLLSLPLMLLTSRVGLRRLMLCVTFLFFIFQVCSALSPTYGTLMASRIGVACTHAIFWSIVSPVAVSVVPERHRPIALSMVITGSSIAMILGMPLGRFIGLQVGWRMTFVCIAAFSLFTFIYLLCTLPQVPSHGGFAIRRLPELLRNRTLMSIFCLTLLFATAYYTGYSYIEPFLLQVAHMSENLITLTLMLFGIAGICGSFAFSRFYPRYPSAFITLALLGIFLCLLFLYSATAAIPLTIALCAVWGMAATSYNVSFQSEIITHTTEDATPIAMSISSGIFNLGIATGTLIGGGVCTHVSIAYIGFIGAFIALAALVFWWFVLRPRLHAPASARHSQTLS